MTNSETREVQKLTQYRTLGADDGMLARALSALTPKPISIKGLTNPANRRTAVVFHRREDIPETFRGWPVIDGDDTDVRHIEPSNVVVALYAKGKARSEENAFVQRLGRDY